MSRAPSRTEPERTRKETDRDRAVAEWTTLGISLSILLALVGLVIYQYVAGGTAAAVIEVQPRLGEVRREGEAYYVPVDVRNRGERTAEDVRVRLSLEADGGAAESAELQVQFLAGGATEHGTVVFHSDPAGGNLSARVVSYLEP
jgi:uncharacterized protein (TIGR02588 family)